MQALWRRIGENNPPEKEKLQMHGGDEDLTELSDSETKLLDGTNPETLPDEIKHRLKPVLKSKGVFSSKDVNENNSLRHFRKSPVFGSKRQKEDLVLQPKCAHCEGEWHRTIECPKLLEQFQGDKFKVKAYCKQMFELKQQEAQQQRRLISISI